MKMSDFCIVKMEQSPYVWVMTHIYTYICKKRQGKT